MGDRLVGVDVGSRAVGERDVDSTYQQIEPVAREKCVLMSRMKTQTDLFTSVNPSCLCSGPLETLPKLWSTVVGVPRLTHVSRGFV
jgi:hypothetical protein